MKNYSVFDTHCDTLCRLADRDGTILKNEYHVDKERMMQYKAYTQIFACFISPEHYDNPKARFEKLYATYKEQDFSGITPILSLEGGEAIDSLEYVDYLADCGIKCIALTWNPVNKLAGGVNDDDTGLTPFGKDVIRRMEKHNILVDVSHLNDKSFYDVADFATRPIIATHSNSRTICKHRRNLTDDMFKLICESGGVAGLNMYPDFLSDSGNADVNAVMEHIRHFISLGGENAIGIGADFDGIPAVPDGLNGCGELYRIFERLEEEGVSAEVIEKISHANFERVFEGV